MESINIATDDVDCLHNGPDGVDDILGHAQPDQCITIGIRLTIASNKGDEFEGYVIKDSLDMFEKYI